ncbi:MAG: polysaccharide biosynthesis/export family protein [Hyphomicrobiaceae bacterium]|nr:polysaccharide biosynthesis/export family protein [Hyphomicrobiaceae bacterium]
MRSTRPGLAVMLAALMSGCSQLPVDGPNHHIIDREAASAVVHDRREVVLDYVLLDISQPVLDSIVDVGPESLYGTFGTGRRSAPQIKVGVGDVVAVSIFESSAGGLFTAGEVNQRSGNFVTLPPQRIDQRGNISVPYAGEIRAVGRPVISIQKDIEERLSGKAIEPQAIIALQQQASAEISVFGDATNGSFKSSINPGGERVLDVIARAGLRAPGYDVFVTLQRGARRATIYFPRLVEAPQENIYVEPGDVLYVYSDPQKFVAVGALANVSQTQGLTGLFNFDSSKLSLAEGVARAGGLLDQRSDGRQVLLYRSEYRSVLERSGVDLSPFPPDQRMIPTIYRANYRDPSVFFYANRFPMRNRDIIYVANADSIEVDKFLSYARLWTSTVAGVASDALITRDSIRALGN